MLEELLHSQYRAHALAAGLLGARGAPPHQQVVLASEGMAEGEARLRLTYLLLLCATGGWEHGADKRGRGGRRMVSGKAQ